MGHRLEQIGLLLRNTGEGVTRHLIAIALVYLFMELARRGDISGDSVTNVIFVVVGWAFGKVDSAQKKVEVIVPPEPTLIVKP